MYCMGENVAPTSSRRKVRKKDRGVVSYNNLQGKIISIIQQIEHRIRVFDGKFLSNSIGG